MISINGEYFEKANAKVSVFEHGFLYGLLVFVRLYYLAIDGGSRIRE